MSELPADVAFEDPDGVWYWAAMLPPTSDKGSIGTSITSPIGFSTKHGATVERAAHFAAPIDATGRRIRTKDELRELIKEAASRCTDCSDAHFGGVYWHERDDSGCNWTVSTMKGSDWAGCLACVQPHAFILRESYSIADERP